MAENIDYKLDNNELIAAIRNYECLYKKKHPDYKNAIVKETAWEQVAQTVENTSYNCKQRWRSLCDRNRKEVIHNGQMGRKPWKMKKAMAFFNEIWQAENALINFSFSNMSNEPEVEHTPSPKKKKDDDPLSKRKRKSGTEDDDSFFDLLRAKLNRLSAAEKDEVQIDILSLVVNKIKNKKNTSER